LLAQHRIDDGGTVWAGPGGGVHDGESLLQALIRELHEEHEETGLMLTAAHTPQLVWVQTVAFPEMHVDGYAGIINHASTQNQPASTNRVSSLAQATCGYEEG
jgi:ADP-ribose pyrophosphatase YjhB (NUDIX family)